MPITPSEALVRCIEHREIFEDEMLSLWRKLMSGELSPVQIAALTMGLRVKKETIGEIVAAAQIMREFATPVEVADKTHLVDLCGTGGDAAHTFNISTAAMFVAAAAGARVAKHGGRGVSSGSGRADVLEALGAHINLPPVQVAACLAETGIGFMFAPNHHAAMKHEVSLGAATLVGELKDGVVREYEIHPEDFGLAMISNRGLRVSNAAESKAMVLEALANTPGTPREIVIFNAGVALYAADVAASIAEGIERARAAIASGAAQATLERFVDTTRRLSA